MSDLQRDIFTRIFETNGFGGTESISGPGSSMAETEHVRVVLPSILAFLGVRHMLDAPCGDFHWMSRVIFSEEMHYTGIDIVSALTIPLQVKHGSDRRSFVVGDLVHGPLPVADLIFCRDALVHQSFVNIRNTLRTMKTSGATWLLTTTFPRHANVDIATGSWRPLNLEDPPFSFPCPYGVFYELHPDPVYSDKALGLWRLSDI